MRESLILENRQQIGIDKVLPGEGLLITRVQSLAKDNDTDSYRIAELVRGSGADGVAQTQDTFNVTRTDGTPGDDSVDPWGDTTAQIYFSSQKQSGDIEVEVELSEYGPKRGHIRYDERGTETNGHSRDNSRGYNGTPEAWSGMVFRNTSDFTQIDGLEVKLRGDSEVSIRIYEKMLDDTPFNLLYTQAGLRGVEGWNRFMFVIPQDFMSGDSRLIVVQVITPGTKWPLPFVSDRTSDRSIWASYSSATGQRFNKGEYVWRNILLLSK
ncbi:MAG: hypothetical protein HOC23_16895 [Halieaceae bacterium]|nr:hypothetical protein [Halieaceae bacterium]